jgi:hypothetical protein
MRIILSPVHDIDEGALYPGSQVHPCRWVYLTDSKMLRLESWAGVDPDFQNEEKGPSRNGKDTLKADVCLHATSYVYSRRSEFGCHSH